MKKKIHYDAVIQSFQSFQKKKKKNENEKRYFGIRIRELFFSKCLQEGEPLKPEAKMCACTERGVNFPL